MQKKKVYLFQINYTVTVAGQDSLWLPYSIGCIAAYAKKHKDITDHFEFGPELFCKREDPQEVIKRLDNPSVVGFSNYVWNTEWNMTMSKLVKETYPDCVVMFGGPNVWADMEKDAPWVDVFLKLEGEFAFVDLLRLIKDGRELPKTLSGERIHELHLLPDPYSTGEFDWLMKNYPDHVWSATYETNRGCPFLCTFCDWGGLTYTKVKKFEMDRVEANWKWFSENRVAYVLSADANVGIFKDRDIEIAHIARKYADAPSSIIDGINFQYNKNNTDICLTIAEILGPYSRGITFAVQSMNESVLEAIKRKNLHMNKLGHLLKEANKRNLYSYTELILPMPEETPDSWKDGLSQVLELGQHYALSVWNTQILRNSEMNQPEYKEKYGLDIIEAYDYINYKNPRDWQGAPEKIELIRATRTMSIEQTVESWVYSILLREFHINGLTQMIARYMWGKHGIRYREFYDRFFEVLKEHPVSKDAIQFLTDVELHYMTTGTVAELDEMEINFDFPTLFGVPADKLPPGHFHKDILNKFIYLHKDELRDIAIQVIKDDLGLVLPEEVIKFNNAYMYTENYDYPVKVELDYDVVSEEDTPVTYSLMPRLLNLDAKMLNKDPVMFFKLGLFKSDITRTDTEIIANTSVHASPVTQHPTDVGHTEPMLESTKRVQHSHGGEPRFNIMGKGKKVREKTGVTLDQDSSSIGRNLGQTITPAPDGI